MIDTLTLSAITETLWQLVLDQDLPPAQDTHALGTPPDAGIHAVAGADGPTPMTLTVSLSHDLAAELAQAWTGMPPETEDDLLDVAAELANQVSGGVKALLTDEHILRVPVTSLEAPEIIDATLDQTWTLPHGQLRISITL